MLTPAQRRVTDELLALGQPRPRFEPTLGAELRATLEEALTPVLDSLPADTPPLWISKNALTDVHSCEAHYLAQSAGWSGWNLATAGGEVTHRAIQLSVGFSGEPTPSELVDHAVARLTADEAAPLGAFLVALPEAAVAELRAWATNGVATFLECWPPLPGRWWPRTELPVRADLCGGRVVLSGKIDLSLGRAVGEEARCLFVDLKTGSRYAAHLDDLRFYALVQTLRIGVPPFRVASYYLDSASFHAEDVSPDTLEIALRRTLDGIRKVVDLKSRSRPATVTPCARCRFCPVRHTCEGAQEWESRRQVAAGELV